VLVSSAWSGRGTLFDRYKDLRLNNEKVVNRGGIELPHHPKDVHGVALRSLTKDMQIREWPEYPVLTTPIELPIIDALKVRQ
jgi:hypothetical protein